MSRRPLRRNPLANYTALRTLQALELLAFGPHTATSTAAALAVDVRTARKLLETLVAQQYVDRCPTTRRAIAYCATARLLSLAAQLSNRHPLVAGAVGVVENLHSTTGLAAYVVIPSYRDVAVIATRGAAAPACGTLLPAADTAAGQVLLAWRPEWRANHPQTDRLEAIAFSVRQRGYARTSRANLSEVALVPSTSKPISAVAVVGAHVEVARRQPSILAALRASASLLAA